LRFLRGMDWILSIILSNFVLQMVKQRSVHSRNRIFKVINVEYIHIFSRT
jgi:hypothetical protein